MMVEEATLDAAGDRDVAKTKTPHVAVLVDTATGWADAWSGAS